MVQWHTGHDFLKCIPHHLDKGRVKLSHVVNSLAETLIQPTWLRVRSKRRKAANAVAISIVLFGSTHSCRLSVISVSGSEIASYRRQVVAIEPLFQTGRRFEHHYPRSRHFGAGLRVTGAE